MSNKFLAVLAQFGVIDATQAQNMQQVLAMTGSTDVARQYAEQRLQEAYSQGLLAQSERLFKFLAQNQTPSAAQWDAFWAQENTALWASVKPAVTETAQQSAIMASVGLGDSWRVVNERVLEWVNAYYVSSAEYGSVENLNQTGRRQVAEAFAAWQRGELQHDLGLPSLALELQETFGKNRAKIIAITETTRIYSEAERQTAIADPDVVYLRWMTGADELVCPVCAPLHGRIVGKEENGIAHPAGLYTGWPPAHSRCRCRLASETAKSVQIPLRDSFNPNLPKVQP